MSVQDGKIVVEIKTMTLKKSVAKQLPVTWEFERQQDWADKIIAWAKTDDILGDHARGGADAFLIKDGDSLWWFIGYLGHSKGSTPWFRNVGGKEVPMVILS